MWAQFAMQITLRVICKMATERGLQLNALSDTKRGMRLAHCVYAACVLHVCGCMRVCGCGWVWMGVSVGVCMCMCGVCMHVCMCMHCVCVRVYICVCMVCVCVSVCVCRKCVCVV